MSSSLYDSFDRPAAVPLARAARASVREKGVFRGEQFPEKKRLASNTVAFAQNFLLQIVGLSKPYIWC